MEKIVLGRIDKIDFRTSLTNVSAVESCEQLPEENSGETIFVAAYTDENLNVAGNRTNILYIPAAKLTDENQDIEGLHIYFDLENYPFYQKAKEVITQEDKPKGVFRFRRMVKKDEGVSLLAGDLYILSSLLGEPKDIKIKQTDANIAPSHNIIMVNFGGGTMAHIEYTVTNQERIELEWSGVKNIIEFDSDEMRPMQPGNNTKLPLAHSVDSILALAHKVDKNLIDRLNYFRKLINGGAHK